MTTQQDWYAINPFAMVHFNNVEVDESALLGTEGKGFLQLMKNFEWERCVLLAELLGEAQALWTTLAAWTNERQQFGVGIKTFQLVQEHITEMQIALTNTRNFLYRTCWKLDNGIPVNNDAAMLKRYGAPALTDVCSRALQLMGGLGFTDQTRVSRLMLDCRGFQIGGGTVEIMVHIAGRGHPQRVCKRQPGRTVSHLHSLRFGIWRGRISAPSLYLNVSCERWCYLDLRTRCRFL